MPAASRFVTRCFWERAELLDDAAPRAGGRALRYSGPVGRLENIIARNSRLHGFRPSYGMILRGVFLLFILAALLFTDWAFTDRGGKAASPPAQPPASPGQRRLDGVPLLRSRPAPAQPPAPAPASPPAHPR